ncbi:carboxymuconolactone decarboxylase family protein [Streptomyces apocyni]|uniref:carboxymuconolactone decarboxylase family protein n=1 Tax=Streptomyces apocyni TaxID=2654677 RepID=UPI0012EA7118|nr:carboxymuconolactone decarboxylase family protein [Streptomyces apocyni]
MPGQYRFTAPVPPKSATGLNAEVFAQVAREFGIERAPTFGVLSAAPELLAATWALLRESLVAGDAPRTGKEIVALGVSLANRCPFCVDAHTVLLHATGDHQLGELIAGGGVPDDPEQARLLQWAKATRDPSGGPAEPFPAGQAPAYLGTVLTFHFVNRIASALLTERLLPGDAQKYRAVRSLAGRSLARTVRRPAEPGEALALLDAPGPGPAWAAGTPVGPAYAALHRTAMAGADLLDADDQALVRAAVAEFGVAHPPLRWAGLPDRDRPGARLAVLAAVAPYRVTGPDVTAWIGPQHTDHCLVSLIAYGAMTAVDRVETALAAAHVAGGSQEEAA